MVTLIFPTGERLEVKLANTYFSRMIGLSGCKDKKAMLFVFPFSARWSIWMPGMYYPVKIIYLNKEKEVVDIKAAVPISKNLATWVTYKPAKACKYVLESPFEHNIKIGDKLQF